MTLAQRELLRAAEIVLLFENDGFKNPRGWHKAMAKLRKATLAVSHEDQAQLLRVDVPALLRRQAE